ncbi:MAG: hypothetical protein ACI9UA_003474, partial [Pseudoalteromonas tetraodonis]
MMVAVLTTFDASATPYSEAILTDSPLAYYQFEESGGTIAADSSGNAMDGSFVNPAGLGFSSQSAQINLGTSLDFSGGHVSVPNLGTHAQSSVELWIRLDTVPSGCCAGILTTNGWDTGRLHLNVNSGRFEHAVNSDSPVSVNTADSISAGTWYHLVVTNDVAANQTVYYLNGIEVADTGDHSAQNIVFGVDGMQIGAWGGGRLLDGMIDELAVYDHVLSAERTAAHFNAASDPGTADILSFTASDGALSSDVGIALPTGGGTVTLAWDVDDADMVEIDNGALAATAMNAGSVEVQVTTNTTFTLSATNPAGIATASVSVDIAPEPADLRLTEFMAENDGSLLDGHGASPDWIEIYNPNNFALDLTGYRLLDGASDWSFPPESTIAALGYLVVFASGNDSPDPAGYLHTNFSLENSGEYVGFLHSDGSLIAEFSPMFPAQFADVSYGVHGDPQRAGYFVDPT